MKKLLINEKMIFVGILNLTPDSFYDGGCYFGDSKKAINRAYEMVLEGAKVIDIGCESTRPNFKEISVEEEIWRLKTFGAPVIKEVLKTGVKISVDTYRSEVARIALENGVSIINDVWGFKKDENMAKVCKEFEADCILMHNKVEASYGNFVEDLISELKDSVDIALNYDINRDKIIVDPGIGFGKNHEQNIEVMRNLELITKIGYPVILGTSRKSMIGKILDLETKDRLEGTIATSIFAAISGVRLLRVHDVKANKRALDLFRVLSK